MRKGAPCADFSIKAPALGPDLNTLKPLAEGERQTLMGEGIPSGIAFPHRRFVSLIGSDRS